VCTACAALSTPSHIHASLSRLHATHAAAHCCRTKTVHHSHRTRPSPHHLLPIRYIPPTHTHTQQQLPTQQRSCKGAGPGKAMDCPGTRCTMAPKKAGPRRLGAGRCGGGCGRTRRCFTIGASVAAHCQEVSFQRHRMCHGSRRCVDVEGCRWAYTGLGTEGQTSI
jgi:hypothetical protein